MKFTKPVIAGIVSGSIVVITGVVFLILYFTGFFFSRLDVILNDELPKVVDAAKADFGNDLIVEALKAGKFEKEEARKAMVEWGDKKLPIFKKGPALIRVMSAIFLFEELAFEKLAKSMNNLELRDKILKESSVIFEASIKVSNVAIVKYNIKASPLELPSEAEVKLAASDKDKKEFLKIYFSHFIKIAKILDKFGQADRTKLQKLEELLKLL